MKFFTTPYNAWPYHLIPYHTWRKGYNKEYKKLIIDPGVMNLQNKKEYPFIEEYPLKVPHNVYWVIPDYPYDVGPNLTQQECIDKTWANITKWCTEPNVIVPVQYRFEDIRSFIEEFTHVYNLEPDWIGIGNLCQSRDMKFLKQVIHHIIYHNPLKRKIHFFGLYKPAIKFLLKCKPSFEVSVDSMKWDYGMHCNRRVGTYENSLEGRWRKFLKYVEAFAK